MQIDRARVNHPCCTFAIDSADGQWSFVRLLFAGQHLAARLSAAKYSQRDIDLPSNNIFHSRDGLRYSKAEIAETLRRCSPDNAAKAFAFLKWQLEHRAAQMLEQDQQMIGVDQRLLGRTLKEIFGMMGEELVQSDWRRQPSLPLRIRDRVPRAPPAVSLKRRFPGSRRGSPRPARRYRFPIQARSWQRRF